MEYVNIESVIFPNMNSHWNELFWSIIRLKGHWTIFLKFSFWLNLFYHVKSKWLLIYQYKKDKIKNSFWMWRNDQFLFNMHKVGMRLICIHVAVKDMVILNQNVYIPVQRTAKTSFRIFLHTRPLEQWWMVPNIFVTELKF